jgi:hypothetical protein
MGARERLMRASAALLGISTYEKPGAEAVGPSVEQIERIRRTLGGNLQPIPIARPRWYLADLETAVYLANQGDLSWAAELMSTARSDGVLSGVLSTRTGGLVRLPKRFRGDPEIIAALELGHDVARSVFDEMFPASDLAALAADGELLGVGVGELVPVVGRDYPVFCRLDPQFLMYRWNEGRWYFRSNAGPLPITPGDGRWILHTPGGRTAPWQHGSWRAVGRAFIRKDHASLYKDEWEAKLANPARVAYAPSGSVEAQKDTFFRQVMAWGVNTVFGLTPGYEIKLLESNGRGYDSFNKTIEAQNNEIVICIAGQTVTTTGGAGFQNSDIHSSIRSDLIQSTADGLAHTLNTQGIPSFVEARYGADALDRAPVVEWDTTPPSDRNAEAQGIVTIAQGIDQLTTALARHGRELDIDLLAQRFALPLRGVVGTVSGVQVDPSDVADNAAEAVDGEPPTPPAPGPRLVREAA